jgi:hypothetical protein
MALPALGHLPPSPMRSYSGSDAAGEAGCRVTRSSGSSRILERSPGKTTPNV